MGSKPPLNLLAKHSCNIRVRFHICYTQKELKNPDIVTQRLSFLVKYVNTKFWNIFKVRLQGCKVKRVRPYHGFIISKIYILLDVLVYNIAVYFYEFCSSTKNE